MSSKTKSDTIGEPKTTAQKGTQSTATQIEQGFRGVEVDPTPNEHYTVAGVTAGKPTPETDTAAAKAARKVTGLGISGIEAAERDRNASGNKGAK